THVCKPEDFPIMPVEYAGFTLKPNGFFAGNIGMDLPPGKNAHSKDNREVDCCGATDETKSGCCH
ncbi:Copper amine oxidase domain-containing protein, partial [Rhizobium sp. PDO1-076]|uniref:copper amine oxidase n=2 Tax=Rhizobium TaxID=379 RepID=UPI00024E23D2